MRYVKHVIHKSFASFSRCEWFQPLLVLVDSHVKCYIYILMQYVWYLQYICCVPSMTHKQPLRTWNWIYQRNTNIPHYIVLYYEQSRCSIWSTMICLLEMPLDYHIHQGWCRVDWSKEAWNSIQSMSSLSLSLSLSLSDSWLVSGHNNNWILSSQTTVWCHSISFL